MDLGIFDAGSFWVEKLPFRVDIEIPTSIATVLAEYDDVVHGAGDSCLFGVISACTRPGDGGIKRGKKRPDERLCFLVDRCIESIRSEKFLQHDLIVSSFPACGF